MKLLKLTCFVLVTIGNITLQAQPNYVPANNLKAYWPMDAQNNANSQGLNVYNSALFPTTGTPPQLVANRFGNSSSAYSFNGSNWIETPCAGVLGDSARAISFWAKTPGNNGVGMYILGWGGNNTGDRFGCFIDYPTGQLTVGGGNCLQPFSSNSNVADNKWHHYVYQFDPANGNSFNKVTVWQDAVQVVTVTTGAYSPNTFLYTINSFNLTFGKIIYPMAPEHYTGMIDEVGLWKRTLTQCEITDLYYSDLSIGTMSFNASGYTGSVNNLAQYTRTLSGNTQFSVPIVASAYSGTGVSFSGGQYHFNSPASLAPGTYTITHTFTLQGGCVKTKSQSILIRENNTNSISENANQQIQVYPNPAKDFLNVKGSTGACHLELKDISGRTILSNNFFNETQIDLGPVADGLYLIELKTENGNQIGKKITVLHH